MKLKEFEELFQIVAEMKTLKTLGWEIDNINTNYLNQGQINIRLIKKEGSFEPEKEIKSIFWEGF